MSKMLKNRCLRKVDKRRKYRKISCISINLFFFLLLFSHLAFAQDLKLWYDEPGKEWVDGLPLGNGRLMAMVQGGFQRERIQLNEESLWTGQPIERDKEGASKYIPKIRQLLFEGKYIEVEELVKDKILGERLEFGLHTYQTLGELELTFDGNHVRIPFTEYKRELDLNTAVSKVSYKLKDATFTREVFVSPVDQAIVVQLACDKPGQLTLDVGFSRKGATIETLSEDLISIHGVATPEYADGHEGVNYECQVHVETVNGKKIKNEDAIRIEMADTVTLRIVAATNYRGSNPRELCEKQIGEVVKKSYANLREDHINEHQRLFGRVKLTLGDKEIPELPTDERLEAFRNGVDDPQLIALYFQFGRYLLMSSSRPGTMAVNLWGKWTNSLNPRYNGDYHLNINISLNYWLAEVCNLGECHEPFIDLIDNLRPRGRITAQKIYGCRGFVAHHTTDAWYFTSPFGKPHFGMWPMAAAWGCHHLWEHYLYGGDKEYLAKKSYPIMKEAAEFFIDFLVEDPNTGYMVSGPSISPENQFISPEPGGKNVAVCMSPTMDIQLLNDLFGNCISASELLGVDQDFRKKLKSLMSRFPPMKIGPDGRLQEWPEPFKENNPGHMTISHLWGLCPGNQISPSLTPELAVAARKALDVRVAHGMDKCQVYQGIGAWALNCYVRLWDGEQAYENLNYLLSNYTYGNLFSASDLGRQMKMFETDVNFGVTAAIAEMLLQSHADCIHILPALPEALPDGKIKGLHARGGFEVDIEWRSGKLNVVTLKSLRGESCIIRYGNKEIQLTTSKNASYQFDGNLRQM